MMPPDGRAGLVHLALIGDGAGILRVRADTKRIADLDVNFFLRSETDAGQEAAARALHGDRWCAQYMAETLKVSKHALNRRLFEMALAP